MCNSYALLTIPCRLQTYCIYVLKRKFEVVNTLQMEALVCDAATMVANM